MSESYTLREVAELLGVSKRTLQRRIQEGAFPGRFLAPGRHGLETRIPVEDVQNVLDDLRRQGRSTWRRPQTAASSPESYIARRTVTPPQQLDSLIPYEPAPVERTVGSGLTQSDLETLRDAMLAIVREEREMFLGAVREALVSRDKEIDALRGEVGNLRETLDSVRVGLASIEKRVGASPDINTKWIEADLGDGQSFDVDSLLKEILELESMVNPRDE